MAENLLFNRNLLALSERNPELSSRLQDIKINKTTYTFMESRSGDTVPAWLDISGKTYPLHSMMDPRKEAFD
jgi:hypothetical protein